MMEIDDPMVLERFRHPHHKGFPVAEKDVAPGSATARVALSATGDNPFCGDTIEVRLVVGDRGGACTIESAAFDGYACSLCAASSDLLMELVCGMTVEKALRMTVDDLLVSWGGMEVGRTRRGCVALPVDVLHRALEVKAGAAPKM